jgi:hypothetical protein
LLFRHFEGRLITRRELDDVLVANAFGPTLNELRRHLSANPRQHRVLSGIARGEDQSHSYEELDELENLGLIRYTEGRAKVRYGVYRQLLGEPN